MADVVQPVIVENQFSANQPEISVRQPLEIMQKGYRLRDLSLRINAKGVHDLRIYYSHDFPPNRLTDLTAPIRDALVAMLSARREVLAMYHRALDKWMVVVEKANGSLGDLDEERTNASRIKQITRIDTLLELFGDQTVTGTTAKWGHNGNLHLINFLYNEIPAEALSLSKIFDTASIPINSTTGGIIFCCGVCRFESNNWSSFQAQGFMKSELVYTFFNPLDSKINEIITLLNSISRQLDSQRLQLLFPIRDETTETHNDLVTRLATTEASVQDLKRIVQTLRP